MLEEEFSYMAEPWEAAMRYLDMAAIPGIAGSEAERKRFARLGEGLLAVAEAAEQRGDDLEVGDGDGPLLKKTSSEGQEYVYGAGISRRIRT